MQKNSVQIVIITSLTITLLTSSNLVNTLEDGIILSYSLGLGQKENDYGR